VATSNSSRSRARSSIDGYATVFRVELKQSCGRNEKRMLRSEDYREQEFGEFIW
jgi:hypothetical protein